jgi:adenosylcobinamide-GDP ribazoletransferase
LFPVSISVLFAIGVMILITGAIHEDGFADFFDGFGGGVTQESILRIMKDSHTGVYGSISISLLMLFKYLSLTEIHEAEIPIVLIGAHSISRLFPVYLINFSQYVRTDLCKSAHTKRKIDGITLTIATIIAFLPLVLFSLEFVAVYITVSFAILILYRRYLHKKIGGFTGDTLGAIQQITEVGFYIAYLSISKI